MQQVGVCILGWVLSVFVIHVIFKKIERVTIRDTNDEEFGVSIFALIFWFSIFLIMPK
jgi:hypothetical protein